MYRITYLDSKGNEVVDITRFYHQHLHMLEVLADHDYMIINIEYS